MTWPGLILAVAALTYASRLLPLGVLPAPPPRVRSFLERVPGPLFAGMAALHLVDPGAGLAPPPVLAAMAAAVLTEPRPAQAPGFSHGDKAAEF